MSQPAAGRTPVELLPPPIMDPRCECGHLLSEHGADSRDELVCMVQGDGWLHWADACVEFDPADEPPAVDHPDGTGGDYDRRMAVLHRWRLSEATTAGIVTWADVLRADFGDVLAAADPAELTATLTRLERAARQWAQAIDRREA